MRHTPRLPLLAAAAVASATGAAAAQDLTREAVPDAAAKWEEAVNAGDAAAVAWFYAEDAVLLPPGAERIDGREAIGAFWRDFIKDGLKVDLESLEVATGGDIAYEIRYGLGETMPDAAAPLTGKYIWTWRQTDAGELEVTADVWNLDADAARQQ